MRYRNQRGSVLLLLVITIPFLFALSAIAVDIGALYLQRAHMQNIADAAALAGASQLGTGQTEAQAMAERYITLNGRTGDATRTQTIQFPSTGQIRVKLERPFPFLFMRYFDFLALDLTVSAVAVAEAYTDSGGGIADYAFVQRGSAPLTLDGGNRFNGSVYTGGELTVTGGVAVSGSVYANSSASITGGTSTVGEAIYINGDLTITGGAVVGVGQAIYANGDLIIAGGATVNGPVYAAGNVIIEGGATVNGSLYTNGNITLTGSGTINGNLAAAGNVNAINSATVTGTITAGGTVTASDWLLNPRNIDPARTFASQPVPLIRFDSFNADHLFSEYDNRVAAVKSRAIGKNEYTGNLTIDTPAQIEQYLTSPLYVRGDVTINASSIGSLDITTAIIASGTITVTKNGSITGIDGVALVSETGSVYLTNWTSVDGLIYAPKGEVSPRGPQFTGGVAADTHISLGGGSTFSSRNNSGGNGGGGRTTGVRLIL
ncbi:MAG: polymer-forming cytoskeletal protein [Sporomusaceae bacterium]|nr:polymer-forming cytoskeletal protein [Sporomusaceae bacterium]